MAAFGAGEGFGAEGHHHEEVVAFALPSEPVVIIVPAADFFIAGHAVDFTQAFFLMGGLEFEVT